MWKKILLGLVAVMGLSLVACSDDDKDEPIAAENLPAAARSFISDYYPSTYVISANLDDNEYEVVLSNGHILDFDRSGVWQDVDAPYGESVPTGFYPSAIDDYISVSYPENGINEISKSSRGYEVELLTGQDLDFDREGAFLGVDVD